MSANDWVRVRSKEEILSTLDANSRLDGLPFQPEMFAFCGQTLRVSKVAHKTCDTINKTGGRKMRNAVHLDSARCFGEKHGNCQAGCVFFWKEAWLSRIDDATHAAPAETSYEASIPKVGPCDETVVERASRASSSDSGDDPTWVCQTTALFEATTPLHWWDIRQYVRDVTSGNHSAAHMFKLLVNAGLRNLASIGIGYRAVVSLYNTLQKRLGGDPFPTITGTIAEGKPTPVESLGLRPGEWVEVKSAQEIGATLTERGFNRGMRFDVEMLKYSGKRYRVELRVDRLINEQTGKMMRMKTPCIQLADVYCRAECTSMRLGCPRASNTYWREIWLRRTSAPDTSESIDSDRIALTDLTAP